MQLFSSNGGAAFNGKKMYLPYSKVRSTELQENHDPLRTFTRDGSSGPFNTCSASTVAQRSLLLRSTTLPINTTCALANAVSRSTSSVHDADALLALTITTPTISIRRATTRNLLFGIWFRWYPTRLASSPSGTRPVRVMRGIGCPSLLSRTYALPPVEEPITILRAGILL